MVIPECGNNTPIIYKNQEKMRKFGEVHKKTIGKLCKVLRRGF